MIGIRNLAIANCRESMVLSTPGSHGLGSTPPPRQGGAIGIMFSSLVIVILGVCGLALDLARLYNRQVELQNIADAVALAAARELDGTPQGVDNALAAAANTVKGDGSTGLWYGYNQFRLTWTDAAISFGKTPARSGGWMDGGSAKAAPSDILYVKVDTAAIGGDPGLVDTTLLRVVAPALKSANTSASAVAGRSTINVTPLAICALSDSAASARGAELVEYGFRRGISYDLMQLNPKGASAAHFVVDPISPPGTSGSSTNTDVSMVGPFVCTGTMAMPRVSGGQITVTRPFPIADLYKQLNSRFDQYVEALCNPNAAPPDSNIRPYAYNTSISWMNAAPDAQTAQSATNSSGGLVTVADSDTAPVPANVKMYGPLWTYARAVSTGYAPFNPITDWVTLYPPAPGPGQVGYPSGVKTPYTANLNRQFPSPAHRPGVANRRVLNIPLLSCPVSAGGTVSATVLAIGRFFMTVPATATSVPAEFAGAVPDVGAKGQVELYP